MTICTNFMVQPKCLDKKVTKNIWIHDQTLECWRSSGIQYYWGWNTSGSHSGVFLLSQQQENFIDFVYQNFYRNSCFILQLLTGYTELELPETRKRISESGFVNVYPFIFNEYAKHGYVSAFNEDLPDYGTFSYRLNGFQEQPTTHFMRPFYLAFQKEFSRHKRLCVGDTPRHKVMLEYTHKVRKI